MHLMLVAVFYLVWKRFSQNRFPDLHYSFDLLQSESQVVVNSEKSPIKSSGSKDAYTSQQLNTQKP